MAWSESWLWWAIAGLMGVLMGSFLNVVIHRLPLMLERKWAEATGAAPSGAAADLDTPYNLLFPRSACPVCRHQIRWYENVPIVSHLVLQGRCSSCQAPIPRRYVLVELLTGLLFMALAWRWGASVYTAGLFGYAAALVVLAFIDWETTLLPDAVTLPLVWGGLLMAALQWSPVTLSDAVWGAVAGYLSLWSVFWVFKLVTGKEGMGYGDFKLLAAIGAWLGWQALIPVVLVASISGTVVGVALKLRSQLRAGGYMPFGPFLSAGGMAVALAPQLSVALV